MNISQPNSNALKRAKNFFEQNNENPDFLGEYVVNEIIDRLNDIQRDIQTAIVLFGVTNTLTKKLQTKNINVTRIEQKNFWVGNPEPSIWEENQKNLTTKDEEYDLVVAPLAMHWKQKNLTKLFEQVNKALKPDGLFLVAMPGPNTLNELKMSLIQAETEVRGGAAQRTDSFIELREVGALLQKTGFALVVTDTDTVTARYDNPNFLISDLRKMGATKMGVRTDNPPLTKKIYRRMCEVYEEKYSVNGRIEASFQIIFGTGWKSFGM